MSLDTEIFIPARTYLLDKQEGREKVIRSCREITSYSKKAIFTLHRSSSSTEHIATELSNYLQIISKHLNIVGDIYSTNPSLRVSITGAIEELVEFLTFGYYKYHHKLLSYESLLKLLKLIMVGEELCDVVSYILSETESINIETPVAINFVNQSDYLMGLFDCTGEIMRMVISSSTSNTGDLEKNKTLNNYKFLKDLYEKYLILLTSYPGISIHYGSFENSCNSKGNQSFKKKLQVFESSIKKVETTLLDHLISEKEIL